MRSDWKEVKLGDVCELISRGITPKYVDNNGIYVLNQKCIRNNKVSFSEARRTDNITKKVPLDRTLKKFDILVNSTGVGTLGRTAQIKNINEETTVDSHVTIVRSNKLVNPLFLGYAVLYNQPYIEALAEGSTGQTELSRVRLGNEIIIPLPPLPEQKAIASILSALDDKIELNNKINENLEQQAQAIFKSWFMDFEPFGGVMPGDWSISTLGEVSDMSAGGDKPDIVCDNETDICKVPIYSNGTTDEGLYGYTVKAKIFDESVTVSARGTIGFVCLRQKPYVPIIRLVSLTPKEEVLSAKYLYLFLKQLHIAGTGTTQQQLTVPNFKGTEIIIPTHNIMSKFTDTINPFYSKILDNKAEIKILCSLRDTLLPKLMSGEIDVANVSPCR